MQSEDCWRCGAAMEWRHGTWQCGRCKFKLGCCEGEPQTACGDYAATIRTGVPTLTRSNSHSASGTRMRMQPWEAE